MEMSQHWDLQEETVQHIQHVFWGWCGGVGLVWEWMLMCTQHQGVGGQSVWAMEDTSFLQKLCPKRMWVETLWFCQQLDRFKGHADLRI